MLKLCRLSTLKELTALRSESTSHTSPEAQDCYGIQVPLDCCSLLAHKEQHLFQTLGRPEYLVTAVHWHMIFSGKEFRLVSGGGMEGMYFPLT